jgi:hypothetical protein
MNKYILEYACPLPNGMHLRDYKAEGPLAPSWWPKWTSLYIEGNACNQNAGETDSPNYVILASHLHVFKTSACSQYFFRKTSLHTMCRAGNSPDIPRVVKVEWNDLDLGMFIFEQLNLKGVLIKMNVGRFLQDIGREALERASHYTCNSITQFREEYQCDDLAYMNGIIQDLDGMHIGYIKNWAKPMGKDFVYKIYVQCILAQNQKKIRLLKSSMQGYPDLFVDEYVYSIYTPPKLDIQAYIYFCLLSKHTMGNGRFFGTAIAHLANRFPYLECTARGRNAIFSRHLHAHLIAWGMYPESISLHIILRYLMERNVLLEFEDYKPDWGNLMEDIIPKDRKRILEKLNFLKNF